MPNVFSRRANFIARIGIAAAAAVLIGTGTLAYAFVRSSYATAVGVEIPQPIPFSHHHHVSGLGIDCRYCHPTAETSAFAGMPSVQMCMNCHSKVWTEAPMLKPLRDAWESGRSIRWRRVHDLPDFVYFDHSIHLAKGIGCSTCHGRVDQMRLVRKSEPLFMKWCLDCHRGPERLVRPEQSLYDMEWSPGRLPKDETAHLVSDYQIVTAGLSDCSICHR